MDLRKFNIDMGFAAVISVLLLVCFDITRSVEGKEGMNDNKFSKLIANLLTFLLLTYTYVYSIVY